MKQAIHSTKFKTPRARVFSIGALLAPILLALFVSSAHAQTTMTLSSLVGERWVDLTTATASFAELEYIEPISATLIGIGFAGGPQAGTTATQSLLAKYNGDNLTTWYFTGYDGRANIVALQFRKAYDKIQYKATAYFLNQTHTLDASSLANADFSDVTTFTRTNGDAFGGGANGIRPHLFAESHTEQAYGIENLVIAGDSSTNTIKVGSAAETRAFTINENTVEVWTDAIVQAEAAGADSASFTVTPIPADGAMTDTSTLAFISAPDFETPASSEGSNTYTTALSLYSISSYQDRGPTGNRRPAQREPDALTQIATLTVTVADTPAPTASVTSNNALANVSDTNGIAVTAVAGQQIMVEPITGITFSTTSCIGSCSITATSTVLGFFIVTLTDPVEMVSATVGFTFIGHSSVGFDVTTPTVNIFIRPDGGIEVTGVTSPGATVTVSFDDANTLTVQANNDGEYLAATDTVFALGTSVAVVVDITNINSNSATATVGQANPATVETAGTLDGGVYVSGITDQPASTVTVLFADGSSQIVTSNEIGVYTATTTVAFATGTTLAVTVEITSGKTATTVATIARDSQVVPLPTLVGNQWIDFAPATGHFAELAYVQPLTATIDGLYIVNRVLGATPTQNVYAGHNGDNLTTWIFSSADEDYSVGGTFEGAIDKYVILYFRKSENMIQYLVSSFSTSIVSGGVDHANLADANFRNTSTIPRTSGSFLPSNSLSRRIFADSPTAPGYGIQDLVIQGNTNTNSINTGVLPVTVTTNTDENRADLFDGATYVLIDGEGADSPLITITHDSGGYTDTIGFITPPDFERPLDADRNNIYEVAYYLYDNSAFQPPIVPPEFGYTGTATVSRGAILLSTISRLRVAVNDVPIETAGTVDGGVYVSGTTDPAVTVTVTFSDGSSQTVTSNTKGFYTVTTATAFATGATFTVTITDSDGTTTTEEVIISRDSQVVALETLVGNHWTDLTPAIGDFAELAYIQPLTANIDGLYIVDSVTAATPTQTTAARHNGVNLTTWIFSVADSLYSDLQFIDGNYEIYSLDAFDKYVVLQFRKVDDMIQYKVSSYITPPVYAPERDSHGNIITTEIEVIEVVTDVDVNGNTFTTTATTTVTTLVSTTVAPVDHANLAEVDFWDTTTIPTTNSERPFLLADHLVPQPYAVTADEHGSGIQNLVIQGNSRTNTINTGNAARTSTISVEENRAAIFEFLDYQMIEGLGADSPSFTVTPDSAGYTATFGFINAPDFENPGSAAGTNEYNLALYLYDNYDFIQPVAAAPQRFGYTPTLVSTLPDAFSEITTQTVVVTDADDIATPPTVETAGTPDGGVYVTGTTNPASTVTVLFADGSSQTVTSDELGVYTVATATATGATLSVTTEITGGASATVEVTIDRDAQVIPLDTLVGNQWTDLTTATASFAELAYVQPLTATIDGGHIVTVLGATPTQTTAARHNGVNLTTWIFSIHDEVNVEEIVYDEKYIVLQFRKIGNMIQYKVSSYSTNLASVDVDHSDLGALDFWDITTFPTVINNLFFNTTQFVISVTYAEDASADGYGIQDLVIRASTSTNTINSGSAAETRTIAVNENQIAVLEGLDYAVIEGVAAADSSSFTVIPASSGLTATFGFVSAPDFETPASSAGTNQYSTALYLYDDNMVRASYGADGNRTGELASILPDAFTEISTLTVTVEDVATLTATATVNNALADDVDEITLQAGIEGGAGAASRREVTFDAVAGVTFSASSCITAGNGLCSITATSLIEGTYSTTLTNTAELTETALTFTFITAINAIARGTADGGVEVTGSAGRAGAGASVTVVFADGSSVTVIADDSASYVATSSRIFPAGTTLTVTAQAAGSTDTYSLATPAAIVDDTPPALSVAATLLVDELEVSGVTEPQATVAIMFADGSSVAATVDYLTGAYSAITTTTTIAAGTTLTATATDINGNTATASTSVVESTAITLTTLVGNQWTDLVAATGDFAELDFIEPLSATVSGADISTTTATNQVFAKSLVAEYNGENLSTWFFFTFDSSATKQHKFVVLQFREAVGSIQYKVSSYARADGINPKLKADTSFLSSYQVISGGNFILNDIIDEIAISGRTAPESFAETSADRGHGIQNLLIRTSIGNLVAGTAGETRVVTINENTEPGPPATDLGDNQLLFNTGASDVDSFISIFDSAGYTSTIEFDIQPDFERPNSVSGDNDYDIGLYLYDNAGFTSVNSQTVSVSPDTLATITTLTVTVIDIGAPTATISDNNALASGLDNITIEANIANELGPVEGYTVVFSASSQVDFSANSCVTDSDGSCSVTASSSVVGTYVVTLTNIRESASTTASVTFVDLPISVTRAIITDSDGVEVVGTAEPGATVIVVFADGSSVTVTADSTGAYTATSTTTYADGTTLTITADSFTILSALVDNRGTRVTLNTLVGNRWTDFATASGDFADLTYVQPRTATIDGADITNAEVGAVPVQNLLTEYNGENLTTWIYTTYDAGTNKIVVVQFRRAATMMQYKVSSYLIDSTNNLEIDFNSLALADFEDITSFTDIQSNSLRSAGSILGQPFATTATANGYGLQNLVIQGYTVNDHVNQDVLSIADFVEVDENTVEVLTGQILQPIGIGADSTSFTVIPDSAGYTATLAFVTAPDFESPASTAGTNRYSTALYFYITDYVVVDNQLVSRVPDYLELSMLTVAVLDVDVEAPPIVTPPPVDDLAIITEYASSNGASTAPTLEVFTALGIVDVTADNIDSVLAAIAASDADEVDTVADIQDVIDMLSGEPPIIPPVPTVPDVSLPPDEDMDGLADSLQPADGDNADQDRDGLSDDVERFISNSDVDATQSTDTDGNGIPDAVEVRLGIDPQESRDSIGDSRPQITVDNPTINSVATGVFSAIDSGVAVSVIFADGTASIPQSEEASSAALSRLRAYQRLGACAGDILPANYATVCTAYATLVDANNNVQIQLLSGANPIWWIVVDGFGNWPVGGAAAQTINVVPQVSFRSSELVTATNATVAVELVLSGNSVAEATTPTAFSVPFTITDSGTGTQLGDGAGAFEFDGSDETSAPLSIITGPSGGYFTISLDTNDGVFVANVDRINPANQLVYADPAAQTSLIVRVVANSLLPPVIDPVITNASGEQVSMAVVGESITITINAFDPDASRLTVTTEIVSDALILSSGAADSFIFTPQQADVGTFTFTVSATDASGFTVSEELFILIFSSDPLAGLEPADIDGDGVPNTVEGLADSDGDRIPDYLEAGAFEFNNKALPIDVEKTRFVTSELGVDIRLGRTVLAAASASDFNLGIEPDEGLVPLDTGLGAGNSLSDIVDFEITNLPQNGQQVRVVIPLSVAIGAQNRYRKYIANVWQDYDTSSDGVNPADTIDSAPIAETVCPNYDANVWVPMVNNLSARANFGHQCIRLTIRDGGPNDADNQVNGVIADPGALVSGQIVSASNSSARLTSTTSIEANGVAENSLVVTLRDGANRPIVLNPADQITVTARPANLVTLADFDRSNAGNGIYTAVVTAGTRSGSVTLVTSVTVDNVSTTLNPLTMELREQRPVRVDNSGGGLINIVTLLGLFMSILISRLKIIRQLLIALPIALVAIFSQADDNKGYYVGGGVNFSSLSPDTADTNYKLGDGDSFGYQLFVGYNFTRSLFFEYDYSSLGVADIVNSVSAISEGDIDYAAHSLGLGWKPFDIVNRDGARLSPFVKVGVCSLKIESDDVRFIDNDKCDSFWGLGLALDRDEFSYRLGYDGFSGDAGAIKLSVMYNFGAKKKPARKTVAPARIVKPKPAAAIIVDNDSDKDGVPNASDLCPNSAPNARVESDGCIKLPTIHFDDDSASILAGELQSIRVVSDIMTRNPDLQVAIEGHSSDDGATAPYNLELSRQRANNALVALKLMAVDVTRLRVRYFGQTRQLCSNETEESQRCNRRVEFNKIR